ncbi:hypothetical protein KI387_015409, partial [Taxus chinensis]
MAQRVYSLVGMTVLLLFYSFPGNAQLFDITTVGTGLQVDFYKNACPNAELIVFEEVKSALMKNPGLAAGLVRMHFHDCFVRGCDASVLIDSTGGNTAEKDALANNPSLRGFEVIDNAKSRLEKECPGVVSCADILAFAARDSSNLASPWGAVSWNVRAGRRDGKISRASEITTDNIPSPAQDVKELTRLFTSKGLSQQDMVVLTGAHTIGVSHCSIFVLQRLYNFSSTHPTDPSLDPDYAQILKTKCPRGTTDNTLTVPMDPSSPDVLDNDYYILLLSNRGLFVSDVTFLTDPNTLNVVRLSAESNFLWWKKFADAMKRMGEI